MKHLSFQNLTLKVNYVQCGRSKARRSSDVNAVWSLLQNLYEENIIITLLSCQNRRKGEKKVLSAFLKPHFNPKRVLFVLAFSPTKLASPILPQRPRLRIQQCTQLSQNCSHSSHFPPTLARVMWRVSTGLQKKAKTEFFGLNTCSPSPESTRKCSD